MEEIKDNSAILFRNRIYRLLSKYETVWFFHDYYGSFEYCKNINDIRYYEDAIITLNLDNKSLTSSLQSIQGVTYYDFFNEINAVPDDEVNSQILECINKIQKEKENNNIPKDIIEVHEKHHEENLVRELKKFMWSIPRKIFETLEKSNEPIYRLAIKFEIDEVTFIGDYKILYQFPNADGKYRKTYNKYFEYIFQKILPMNDDYKNSGRLNVDTIWITVSLYYLLTDIYPFLKFEIYENNIIINLPKQN